MAIEIRGMAPLLEVPMATTCVSSGPQRNRNRRKSDSHNCRGLVSLNRRLYSAALALSSFSQDELPSNYTRVFRVATLHSSLHRRSQTYNRSSPLRKCTPRFQGPKESRARRTQVGVEGLDNGQQDPRNDRREPLGSKSRKMKQT